MINIIRSEKKGKVGFTNISNEILQSKTLKPHEVGVLVHLLSLPQDFVIHKSTIWKQMNIGRDQFDKIWKNLVRLGYIQTIKYSNGDAKKTFGYRHIVYEVPPSPENQCTDNQDTDNQDTDKQDIRTLISSDWKSGCIQSNNTKDTGTVSNSRNGVEVRHGIPKVGQAILGPEILGQYILGPGTIEEDIPIVPHPQLRFGIVRDNEEAQINTTSTKEQIMEPKVVDAQTEIPSSGVSIGSIGRQTWIQQIPIYDIATDIIPEDFEPDETSIAEFRDAIDKLYEDKFPNWETLLKDNPLHTFLQETSELHEGIPSIIEVLTILKNHLKQNVPVK